MTKNKAAQLLGSRGGRRTAELYGPEFAKKRAKKGGTVTSKKYGPEFYAAMSKKGHAARWGKKGAAELPTSKA